ncbi:hypothetical protein [Pseudomonas wadenswilerensis]|uniref:phosphoribosyltransferase-like protein n=1 Tax=Pseudomonas wadenswilerensis TaxID=1785161 RepID=UPI0021602610|nr:hypothetical protein [Pseudomonas wadenswilerensis]UVM21164.1 hypothetical protein LOY45_22445 [Pseudomonas wadenswilerensis]
MEVILPSDKWRYMVTTGLWPKKGNFDPIGWCSNFNNDELPLALRLLEGFTFFADELVKQMFRSAFLNVSQHIITDKNDINKARQQWASFVDSLVVVRVTGEIPRDADSGFAFSRLARDVLLLNEERIVSPEIALEYIAQGNRPNILFVDDFVGSGNQFVDTWEREYRIGNYAISFKAAQHALGNSVKFIYCPVVCTELGRGNINQNCQGVNIIPAHFYSTRQSALSNDSAIWRDDMRTEGPEFVKTVSMRAGIPDTGGGEDCWRGFHKLGLALAFAHGCPDATLPIFYSQKNDWKPLIKKGAL